MAPTIKNGSVPRTTGSGSRQIRPLEREVVLAGEEAQERPALLADVIANRPLQHRIAGLHRVEHRTQRDRALHRHLDLASDPGQRPQVLRQLHSDHGSVCTSTDNTAGRSRTIGVHVSPESADAYTWPPVVPK